MSDTRYYRIAPKFWRHATAGKWTDQVGYLAFYLLTNPHRNIAGLYYLPRPYIMADLGWDSEKLEAAFDVLLSEDFARYDDDAHVILIVNALSYDAPENVNQRKGAIKALNEVPETPLWLDLYELTKSLNEDFANDIRELTVKRFPKLFREPLDQPLPEQNGNSVSVSVTVKGSTTTTAGARETIDWRALEKAWFEHLGGPISAIAREELPGFMRDSPDGLALPLDVVVYAFREADRNHARTWAYVSRVLTNYRQDGVRTTADCEARTEQRQQSKDGPKGAKNHDRIATRVNAGRHDDPDSLDDLVQGG